MNGIDLHFSSATGKWNTPADVIRRVEAVFGTGIDCDPCADEGLTVPARCHYTEAEDGLAQVWMGNVYINPPYGRSIGEWVDKGLAEYCDQRADSLLFLVPARVDTKWWRRLTMSAAAFAIVRGRLTFSDYPTPAPFPSALVYYGGQRAAFEKAFAPPFADHYTFAPVAYEGANG